MPRPFNPNMHRRKNTGQAPKNEETVNWAAFSLSGPNDSSEQKKSQGSVFDSVLNRNEEQDNHTDRQDRRQDRRPHARNNNFRKPKNEPHDKNDNKLNRSNILTHTPSDQVQVSTYISLLEEFIENSGDIQLNVPKSDTKNVATMIDDFTAYLTNLTVDDVPKEIFLPKLVELQEIIETKIQSLTDASYDRTKNWVMKNELGRSINSLHKLEVASNKSDARSTRGSNFSARFKINEEELKVVNCQFCNELQPNLAQLINHLDNNCQKFKDRDFDISKKNDLSHYQILPTNAIKCNLCDRKFNDLVEKKEHDASSRHKDQVKKNQARDSKKTMTSFIFCSCCKVNVPDNFIQFKMHLDNQEHNDNKTKKLDVFDLAETGTQMIIVRKNKVKCLSCHNLEFIYDKEKFDRHRNDDVHEKNVQKRRKDSQAPVYCELCSVHLPFLGVGLHLASPVHLKHLQDGTSPSETSMKNHYCVFCNKAFPDLKKMAVHQESSCSEIKKMRDLHQGKNDSFVKKEKKKFVMKSDRGEDDDGDEDEEEEPTLSDQYKDFFKDLEWTQKAATVLKAKADKRDLELEKSIAEEVAREINCKKVSIFGSRSCGLAFDNCDLNIFCDFSTGKGDETIALSKIGLKVAGEECYNLLRKSEKFVNVKLLYEVGEPFILCEHKESEKLCKISFRKDASELETEFFKYCMSRDNRIQEFLLLLKLWMKVQTPYIGEFSSFVLMILGVFFLRSRGIKMLPLPSQELTDSFEEKPFTVSQLFYKFCNFYGNFDYSTKMIHTGFEDPLPKKDFLLFLESKKSKISTGNEFSDTKLLWLASNQNEYCNVGKFITRNTLKKFAKACIFTKDRLDR